MNSDYMLCSGVRRAQFDLGGGITLTCSDNMSKLGRKRRVNLTLRKLCAATFTFLHFIF